MRKYILRVGLGLASALWSSGLVMVLQAPHAQAAEPFVYHFGSPQAIRTSGLSGDELADAISDEVAQLREAKAEGATIQGMNSSTAPTSTETRIQNLTDGAGSDTWSGVTVQANDETGRLYMAWLDDRHGGSAVYTKVSTDGGATWSSQKRIDDDSGVGDSDFSLNIATGGHGDVYVVWGDDRETSGTQRLFFASSMDAGATWSDATEIASASDLVGLPNAIVADGKGGVLVAWEDARGAGTDIFATHSTNFGETWSDDVRINDVVGGGEIGPIAVMGRSGDISVFWQSDRAGGAGEDLMTARSTDWGDTWSADVRLNTNAAGTRDLDNWDAASDGAGGVHAFYTTSAGGASSDDVTAYARSSTDYGATWGGQKKISGSFEVEETIFAFFFLFAGPIMGNATFDGTNHRAVFAFDGGPAGGIFGDAMVTTTENGGSSWRTPEKIDTDPTGDGEIGVITADINNEAQVLVAYTDTRFGTNDVFINYSDDNGATWQASDDKVDGAAAGSSTKTLTGSFFFFVNLPGVEGGNNDARSNFYVTYFDNRASAPGLYLAKVTFTNDDEGTARLAGATRIETGIAISQNSFPADHSAGAMIVATSGNYPDALAAGPLANMVGGPVLLTPGASLDAGVAAEIVRVFDGLQDDATDVFIVGGPAAVSTGVESAIAALDPDLNVQRVGGANRIGTAILIAQTMDILRGRGPSAVMVTTSQNFPDALSASAPASDTGVNGDLVPILLTGRTALDASVSAYLTGVSGTATNAYIIGGTAALNDAVLTAVDTSIATVERLAGANRNGTATAVASRFYAGPLAPLSVGVATGLNFPDALTGGAHSGRKHQPLVLVRTSDVPTETVDYLTANAGTLFTGFFYGGTAAISDAVKAHVESLI